MPCVSTLAETRIGMNGTPLATWQPGERKQLDLASFRQLRRTARCAAYLAWAWPRAVSGRTLATVAQCSPSNIVNVLTPLLVAGSVCRAGKGRFRLVRPDEEAPRDE